MLGRSATTCRSSARRPSAENPDGSALVEFEHARIDFDSPFSPAELFHFRLGKFKPNLADGFQEMWISTNSAIDSIFNSNPIGVNGGTGLGADAMTMVEYQRDLRERTNHSLNALLRFAF